jgi:hypothetical protein
MNRTRRIDKKKSWPMLDSAETACILYNAVLEFGIMLMPIRNRIRLSILMPIQIRIPKFYTFGKSENIF